MKSLLTAVALLGLCGVGMNLSAQEPQSPNTTATQTQPVDTQSQHSAQSFEGTITKSGDKLVLTDSSTQATYQLDDQDKAKQYEGKKVTVMATMDANTSTLHVVDIAVPPSR
jgi:Protein of unknown function (DUF5818)